MILLFTFTFTLSPIEFFSYQDWFILGAMGRTVATWRDRIERRISAWSGFRRALRLDDRIAFDYLLNSVRNRSSACGMMPASDEFEPALLSMLIDLETRLSKVEKELSENG
tara:strand:+ start:469 stop:801 length:333 start_codon:yes stop_codon:yes gene_type:complete